VIGSNCRDWLGLAKTNSTAFGSASTAACVIAAAFAPENHGYLGLSYSPGPTVAKLTRSGSEGGSTTPQPGICAGYGAGSDT
jgi:hypothetical protein